jgi:hypothetical protein
VAAITTITPEKILEVLEKVYDIPTDEQELLVSAGLTERQATAIRMLARDVKIEDISVAITGKKASTFTQNAHDALNGAVTKILNALLLVYTITNNRGLLQAALDRVLAVGSRFPLEPKDGLFDDT